MRKTEEFSDKKLKLLFISLIAVVVLFLLVIFVAINITFGDDEGEDKVVVEELYYEISVDELPLPHYEIGQDYVSLKVSFPSDYEEKDSYLDEDYYLYSPVFAKLRNLCEIESSQSIKYIVNDDTDDPQKRQHYRHKQTDIDPMIVETHVFIGKIFGTIFEIIFIDA